MKNRKTSKQHRMQCQSISMSLIRILQWLQNSSLAPSTCKTSKIYMYQCLAIHRTKAVIQRKRNSERMMASKATSRSLALKKRKKKMTTVRTTTKITGSQKNLQEAALSASKRSWAVEHTKSSTRAWTTRRASRLRGILSALPSCHSQTGHVSRKKST